MAKILLIETSTALCSAALSIDGKVIASRRDAGRAHASLTAVFCDEVLREAGLKPSELDAVCISEGPGSYTGLRVGLSTAKGICFGSGAKLLSVSSLDILAAMAPSLAEGQIQGSIVPMIDARRMEVYTAEYSIGGKRISPIEAKVIEEGSFSEESASKAVFIGDGALKCKDIIGSGTFIEAWPDAAYMGSLAEEQYRRRELRDIAYFEPFYLKEFTVTQSKKKLF